MDPLLNRRDVLKIGSGAVVAAVGTTAAPSHAADAAKRRPYKKAVMYSMIKAGKTVLENFQALKEAGFDGVEMDSPSIIPIAEIQAACEKTGILIEGVVDSVHWRTTLSHNSPQVRADAVKALETAVRDCKTLGGTSVLLVPGVVDKSVAYDDCWNRSQEGIRQVIPISRELGIKIAIENVGNHFIMSPLEAIRYMDELAAPDVIRWHLDLGNLVLCGWPEQWVRILNKRIFKLHFKEFSRTRAMNEGLKHALEVELTEGENDWPAIMKALDEAGYNTWACAEVRGGDLERLKFISQRLDKILAM